MNREDPSGGRYLLRKVLGEGGAGRVWLVEDRLHPGNPLALKELAGTGHQDLRYEEELRREFATLACLRHPNLVEVHEFDVSENFGPRFTLEFIQGRDLVAAVAHEGPAVLPGLVAEALRALGFLHDFGLVHRDLKPGNLLVRDRPKLGCRLVVLDFGLVHRGGDDNSLEAMRARGTLPYMAPELFRNECASRRSDLYALGAVVHEAVWGRPPVPLEEGDLARFLEAVAEGRRSRSALQSGFAPGFRRWIEEMLSPDAEARPATAQEALARFNEACGTRFSPETPVSRAARLMSGPPFERQAAITRIWEGLDPSSGPRIVWLCGDAGSGKTRVLRWVEAEAVLKGWRVFSCVSRLTRSLAELRTLAADHSVLLLLDDADLGEGESATMLDQVARESERPALQVVAALRPSAVRHPALSRLLADTGTVPTLRRVDLEPLDRDAMRALATRAMGSLVSEERVQWLLQACDGSAARAESLLIEGAWERGGVVVARAEREPLPLGLLEALSAEAATWLEGLAVLRREGEDDQVARFVGMAPEVARVAAAEASAAGLATRRGGRWAPNSRALAEQLRARTQPDRRRALHRAAAELLEADPAAPADPSLLSELWAEAGEADRAVARSIEAAERSESRGDPAEAASRYADALRLLGRRRSGRHELRRRQGKALESAGLHAAAARAFGAAVRLAPEPKACAETLARQALAIVQAGRFGRALDAAVRAELLAEEAGDEESLAAARHAAGIALGRLGREAEAIPLLEGARDLLRRLGRSRAEADVLHSLATCNLRLGREEAGGELREAIEIYRRARAEGLEVEDGRDLKARIGLAVLESRAGRFDEAASILEQVRKDAEAQGHLSLQEAALARLAAVAIDNGGFDRAIALAEQATDLALHLGDPNLYLVNHARLAEARIRSGRAREALAPLEQTLASRLDRVEPENADYARMLLAEAWLEAGGAEEEHVRGLLEESLHGCRGRGKSRALLMALALEMEHRSSPASVEPFEPIGAEFDEVASEAEEIPSAEIRARAELARAAHHLSRGAADAALACAEKARVAARERGALDFEARAHGRLAEALDALGRGREADEARKSGRRLLSAAAERIESEEVRADFRERPVFAMLFRDDPMLEQRDHARLRALYDMIRVLNSETDPEALLESILDMALRAIRAERGMILLKDEKNPREFSVRLSRNLETETVADAESYSRHIVAAATAGRSMLALDAKEDPRFRDLKSVSLYGIRSLLCVPLRSRGSIEGTVYLDSRRDGVLFTPDDLRFLEAFADHAALALENVRARARLERENLRLRVAAEVRSEFGSLVGRSPAMRAVFDLIEKAAATDLPVLIHGESGTGKELVARAVHFNGPRRRGTFVSENCAAIPESLLESELFGHVRGAFTGAERSRPGLFEQADGGTLFLDEIGDMPAAMQARLLRVLEDGKVRRVGAEKTVDVDVRVVTATHRDLAAEVVAGRFRQDLIFRLQVVTVELPPLRKRFGDIELLATCFLARIAAERGRTPPRVDDEVLALFERYGWPGNVRELQNTLQRLVLLAGSGAITRETIEADPGLRESLLTASSPVEPQFSLKSGERERIRTALEATRGSRVRAATLLGVSRATLYRKLKEHGI